MPNQTATAFETFNGTLEERGSNLAKLEKKRITSLEKAHQDDTKPSGLAYQIGQLLHELTQESESGRISSQRLSETSMNRVASQRRSEALQYYRKFAEIQLWLASRKATKRKHKIAFTSITAMLKAFKDETQPKVDTTDDKSSATPSTKVDEKPNVGTKDQPKVDTQDAKASDTQPKVEKVRVPQNSKEFADYVHKLVIKFGFDKDEVLEAIFDSFENKTAKKRVA
tara:strand:- start:294 stop:971 length:678 start_codon:yes stop_codon:yes gene_type:complete